MIYCLLAILSSSQLPEARPTAVLQSGHFRVEFSDRGIRRIGGLAGIGLDVFESPVEIVADGSSLKAEGKVTVIHATKEKVQFEYDLAEARLEVEYEVKPSWQFVSKRVRVYFHRQGHHFVDTVDQFNPGWTYPGVIRSAGGASSYVFEPMDQSWAYFGLQQNPFTRQVEPRTMHLIYQPKIDWDSADGPFETDRACFGRTNSTGEGVIHAPTIAEWKYVPNLNNALQASPSYDIAEYDAIEKCVGAFVDPAPKRTLKVHISWCENDYQIDLANPDGPPQYHRILQRAKDLGCDTLLFTPQNSKLAKREESTDAWAWESLLWLGYGIKIREGKWSIEKSPIDPSVQEFLNEAKHKHINLLAYVYPTLAWPKDPAWTEWAKKANLPLGGYVGVDTGSRSFQNWFVDTLIQFINRTGIAGVSFDHWWIAYDKASSPYSQWYGCRRILQELRRRKPDIVIDGRQQYQSFGVWTWMGGSYPHPTGTDEQPGSFRPFADLHMDRVAADHQRYVSYRYTVREFTPPSLNPGFISHQTQRNGPNGFTTNNFRLKDWDVQGWKYSLLSTIATAPYNLVVNMIPARNSEEFRALSKNDQADFRKWMAWPDQHRPYIAKTRPILGPPMVGKVDGTSMIDGSHGYLFLFNPNYRGLPAEMNLNRSIGLTAGLKYTIRQIYPTPMTLGSATGSTWSYGQKFKTIVTGTSAVVLEIGPAPEFHGPIVLDTPGEASLENGLLSISGIRGPAGTHQAIRVSLPVASQISKAEVDGKRFDFSFTEGIATVYVSFPGEPSRLHDPVIPFDGSWESEPATGSFRLPQWLPAALNARKAKWPVTYSEDDLLAPWLGQDRIQLFVAIADPNDKMTVTMSIDGKVVPLKKAYNAIYPNEANTFLGWYLDIADLPTGQSHQVEVHLPKGLAPGQFQGVYLDGVDPSWGLVPAG